MAVALDEPWGMERHEVAPPKIPPPRQDVEADTHSGDAPRSDTDEITLPASIVEELSMLRSEESRRCTVYIAVAGILFAILFIYVDKVQHELRVLNANLRVITRETSRRHTTAAYEGPQKWFS